MLSIGSLASGTNASSSIPAMKNPKDLIAYSLAVIAGVAVCLTIAAVAGRNEAWDADIYYSAGIPIMCLMIFVLAYFFPLKPWRWTIAMAVGQFLSALINGSSLSLWPLAMIFMAVISIPQFVAGYLGAKLSPHKEAA